MISNIQFGAIRPSDVQKGAAFVSNSKSGPKTLYVVTSEPGKQRYVPGRERLIHEINDRPIETMPEKKIDINSLQKHFKQKNLEQKNLEQKNLKQKNLEQKTKRWTESSKTGGRDHSPDSVHVSYQTDVYTQQEDGSFLKTGESSSPLSFPVPSSPPTQPIQTGYDVAKIERQEGERIWLEA